MIMQSTLSRRSRHGRLSIVAIVLACVACSPAQTEPPAQGLDVTTSTAPGPTSDVSVQPGLSPVPQSSGPAASPAPPAPTADGPLDDNAFPNQVLGFRSVPGEAAEGEYQSNGTWVHAVDPREASMTALPRCGDLTAPVPAVHALAATYADPSGRPGNGLALEFADTATARTWLAAYTTQLSACPKTGQAPLVVRGFEATDDGFWARRYQATDGHEWTEAGSVRDSRVTLLIISGGEHEPEALLRLLR